MKMYKVMLFVMVLGLVAISAWYGGKLQAQSSASSEIQGIAAMAAVTPDDASLMLVQGKGHNQYAASSNWNSGNIIVSSNERYLYLIRGAAVYQFDAKSLKFIDARTLPNYTPRSFDDRKDSSDYDDDDDDDDRLPWPWN